MDKGKRAFRNDFQTHFDDVAQEWKNEEVKQYEEERNEEMRALNAIASLDNHPGWQQIKKAFQQKINDYHSGKVLAGALLDAEVTNDKIGELARTTNLVATELESLLTTVEGAVIAKKEEDDDRRPKRRI